MNNALTSATIIAAVILSSCASLQEHPSAGPSPGEVFKDQDVAVRLTYTKQYYNYNQTCELGLKLTNTSTKEQEPKFRLLLLDKDMNTLQQTEVQFPTVFPGKEFVGVKYIYMLPCDRISNLKFQPMP